jgi:Xaa-Pro aminopeptidase
MLIVSDHIRKSLTDTFRKMRKIFKSADVSLKPVPINLIDVLWSNERPSVPSQPLLVLPTELTGKSWQQKIDEIRHQLVAKRVQFLLLTALDEIACM